MVGTNKEDLERAKSLIDNGCDLIVIDTAHGHSSKVLTTLSKLKKLVALSLFAQGILQQEKRQSNYIILELTLLKLE